MVVLLLMDHMMVLAMEVHQHFQYLYLYELLDLLFKQKAEWRKDMLLKLAEETEPFFKSQFYSFNWTVFIISSLFVFVSLYALDYYSGWKTIISKLRENKQ
jgi:hypothetical protein